VRNIVCVQFPIGVHFGHAQKAEALYVLFMASATEIFTRYFYVSKQV